MNTPKKPGMKCRCSVCERIFKNVNDFNQHLAGRPGSRKCGNPEYFGMQEKNGVWFTPGRPKNI